VSASRSDFAVGIRSALVHGDQAVAFGGAGIVQGSEADAEWLETARKMESFDAVS
jgi:menaquinone-specific isochorismate synthase